MTVLTPAQRDRTAELHRAGLSHRQIAAELGLSKSTVGYRLKSISEPLDEDGLRCHGCGWRMLRRADDGLCGFCRDESTLGEA